MTSRHNEDTNSAKHRLIDEYEKTYKKYHEALKVIGMHYNEAKRIIQACRPNTTIDPRPNEPILRDERRAVSNYQDALNRLETLLHNRGHDFYIKQHPDPPEL